MNRTYDENRVMGASVHNWFLILVSFFIAMAFGKLMFGTEFTIILQWSLLLIILGLVFLPVTGLIFHRFHDGGWLFAKTIGIAVSGWLVWYLSSIFLKFTRTNCFIVIVLCFITNVAIYLFMAKRAKAKEQPPLIQWDEQKIISAVTTELLFFVAFLLWCYVKGFKPEAYGTEKFMDYGFMTAIMRADYMPAEDLWLSGESINYYYVGQFLGTYLTKLAGTTVNYGYNLMLMTIAAFSISLPYSLVYNIAKQIKKNPVFQHVSGLLAGIAVTLTSSMHYPMYKFIIPFFGKLRGEEIDNSYWFPDATRYIGYNPETTDKTIHEFPNYSFVLGDLHAHVINIMFVITILAILFAFLLYHKDKMDKVRSGTSIVEVNLLEELFHPAIIFIGFFLGLFNTTNFWDFPIYFVVSGAIILFSNAVICRYRKSTLKLTLFHAVVILVIAELVCLPFTINFKSMSSGIAIAVSRTPLYQFAILWALPIFAVVFYFIVRFRNLKKNGLILKQAKTKKSGKDKKNLETEMKGRVFQLIKGLEISDLFIITIGFCAIGLVFLPEIVYVRDIYSGDYKRANTMFKLTYQAYIMFGICMGYITIKLIGFGKKILHKGIGFCVLLLLLSTVCYTKEAFSDWFGDITDTSGYKGLDAAVFMEAESMADYLATNWLNENVTGTPVVLEANGDSYTFFQRVSVVTGLPTVLGWKTHEWLWRCEASFGVPPVVTEREEDILTIYTSTDISDIIPLIEKYKIEYIYVGGCEREKFGEELNEEALRDIGMVVFETMENDLSTYIIKIN